MQWSKIQGPRTLFIRGQGKLVSQQEEREVREAQQQRTQSTSRLFGEFLLVDGERKVIGERCGNTEQWKVEKYFGDGREKRVPVGAVMQGNVFTGEIGLLQARSRSRWDYILHFPRKSRASAF